MKEELLTMNEQEAREVFKAHEPTIRVFLGEVKKIIGIKFFHYPKLVTHSVAYSVDEAMKLDHNQIDTGHLLLGLLRQGGIVSSVLLELGVNFEKLKMEVKEMINTSQRKFTNSLLVSGDYFVLRVACCVSRRDCSPSFLVFNS